MPFYIVRKAPKDATLKDAADGLVIDFAGSAFKLAELAAAGSNGIGDILTELIAVICQSNHDSQFHFLEGLTFAVDAFDEDDFDLLSEDAQLYFNDLIKRRKDSSLFAWPGDCKYVIDKRVPRPKIAATPKRSDTKPAPKPKPPTNSMKGKLRPTIDDKLPASVLVVRACRGRGLSSSDLCDLFEQIARPTITSAVFRMTEKGYLELGIDGDLTTTDEGEAALAEFDTMFPNHAEPKNDKPKNDNEPQPPVTE